jgi:hypothetical protein
VKKRMIIQYTVKSDRAAENQQFIEGVFAELHAANPAGIRYAAFKKADGVSFVHVVSVETETGDNPLQQVAAFQAFQAGIADRCVAPPVVAEIEEVGSYHVFGA